MWFSKGPKNAKRSRTVRKVEVNLPGLRYSREKIEFSEPQSGPASAKPAGPVLTLKPAPLKALPKPGKARGK
jgi:hypothetical protein